MSQTAYNASGSDTVTRAGYISVCTYQDFYPDAYSSCSGSSSNPIVGGTLANLQSADGVTLDIASNSSYSYRATSPRTPRSIPPKWPG